MIPPELKSYRQERQRFVVKQFIYGFLSGMLITVIVLQVMRVVVQ